MLFVIDPDVLSKIVTQSQQRQQFSSTQIDPSKPSSSTQSNPSKQSSTQVNPSQQSPSTQMNINPKNENKLSQWPVGESRLSSVWSVGAEKLVLEIYKELECGPPLKNKWENMSKLKYSFSGEQCRLKIKHLKERHLKLKKKLNKSGSDNPMDDLESDIEDTFGNQPDVHLVHLTL